MLTAYTPLPHFVPHRRIIDLARVRASGTGKDTSVPQGSGAPLHPSLEPANDVACRQPLCGPVTQLVLAYYPLDRAALVLQLRTAGVQCLLQGRLAKLRPPVGMVHDKAAWLAQELMPDVKCRP
jgi:hypothetical protein